MFGAAEITSICCNEIQFLNRYFEAVFDDKVTSVKNEQSANTPSPKEGIFEVTSTFLKFKQLANAYEPTPEILLKSISEIPVPLKAWLPTDI